MTILLDARLAVEPIEADPTALDRLYAAETSPFASEHHADEPTPVEALTPPWWEALPWSVDLDTPVEELLAEEPEAFALPRGATRVDPAEEAAMWGRGRPGDAALIDRLGRCEYP